VPPIPGCGRIGGNASLGNQKIKDEFFLINREDEDGTLITVGRDKRDTGSALRAGHLGPPEQLKKENAMPRRYPESTPILISGAPSGYHV